jgi:hypothetical protein
MNGNLMYEMARQRIAEQQRAARQASEARGLRSGGRRRRARDEAAETVATPAIPDYPHEMFTTVPEPRKEAADGGRTRSGR